MILKSSDSAFKRGELALNTMALGPFQTNCYVLSELASGICLVIDPGMEPEPLLELLKKESLKPQAILLTHGHLDHIGGCRELTAVYDCPIHLHSGDQDLYSRVAQIAAVYGLRVEEQPQPVHELSHGQWFAFGSAGMRISHGPGHSPGSVCLHWKEDEQQMVCCGDLIFKGSFGRVDLPGGDAATLVKSIRENIFSLEDSCRLYSGHGEMTTVGAERHTNPINTWFSL